MAWLSCRHAVLALIALVSYINNVAAFHPRVQEIESVRHGNLLLCRRRALLSRSNTVTSDAVVAIKEPESAGEGQMQEEQEEASFIIQADYTGLSKPAPATSTQAMVDFFDKPATRYCLISAGNTRETKPVVTTDKLLGKWKKRALELGAGEPTANDEIVSVDTGGIRFPGITVETTSTMGTKLLLPTRTNRFPSFEFILIQDQRKVIGLRPIVWVYNQLVGASSKDKNDNAAPMCMSRITVIPSKETNKNIQFKIESFLEIRVNFPAIMLKILPVRKEKAEARGVNAVKKMLKSDVDTSLTKIRELYTAML